MGVTTDYVGRIDINPVLNRAEREYLAAFADSRRFARAGGPYALPASPRGRDDEGLAVSVEISNNIASGQPSLWCQWEPCSDGCCVAFNGQEKFYNGPLSLAYLIEHFLQPKARASFGDDPQFADFSFDHHADGLIVGSRRDDGEMMAIRVEDNVVSLEVLVPGKPEPRDPLPYQLEYDRQAAWLDSCRLALPESGAS